MNKISDELILIIDNDSFFVTNVHILLLPRLFPNYFRSAAIVFNFHQKPQSFILFTHTPAAILVSHSIAFNHFFFGLPFFL